MNEKTLKTLLGALFLLFCLVPYLYAETGLASWYSSVDACGPKTNNHPGCPTADGSSLYKLEETHDLFAASNNYALGTRLRVSNQANGQSVVVVTRDRGGFKKYGRVIDLGRDSFKRIAEPGKGVINVSIKEVL